ncbi:GNAT family N-acetyltransferase [Zafaria sp. Z1313]|uniref:GNAT family N-acetyltransferase n=1 Tax=unclassified Zafaria TaxID=2828765 RepID=UPI002E7816DC|nr:GNAT family N-acetyltransferase [Zafaria sp. J156]MEE1621707.1 GNAT family N-acetyltransferase [Zafaria sp. J156]
MTVRRATPEDLPVIERVLTAAFDDDAWTRWTVPEAGRRQRVKVLQRAYAEHVALPRGAVWVDDAGSAVAAFIPEELPLLPGHVQSRIAAAHGELIDRLDPSPESNGLRNPALLRVAAATPSWTLASVGVLPDSRGRGLGTAVCRAGLGWLDERGLGCVLETSQARTVGLYRSLGFETLRATATPGGPAVWEMFRAPGGHPATAGRAGRGGTEAA